MRQFLITKFVCAKCGEVLELSTERKTRADHCQGEPTGAEKFDDVIAIHPCSACLFPVTQMQKALQTLVQIAGVK